MPTKNCEVCGSEFQARLSKARACGVVCRNRLIAREKEEKNTVLKECAVCSKPFTGKRSGRTTCSSECQYKMVALAKTSSLDRQCLTCGCEFKARPSTLKVSGGGNYCSSKCFHDRNRAKTTRDCACCGKAFHSPPSQMHVKTCSTVCGYKIRKHPNEKEKIELKCDHCGKSFFEYPSRADQRTYCSKDCMFASPETTEGRRKRATGELNPAWQGGVSVMSVSSSGKTYRRSQTHVENEKDVRRKRAKELASPVWRNHKLILEIYAHARRLSKMTGIQHHVDHIVPLTSKLVCGLHNEFNLRVIPGDENLKKHNRHWPDKP